MRKFLCIASTQLACWAAQASGLQVQVQDREGQPLPEAVVVLYPVGRAAPVSAPPPGPVLIEQERMRFVPALTVVVPGTQLRFANLDRWDHHVRGTQATGLAALDPNAPVGFEFRLAGRAAGQAPAATELVVDKPGVVLLGCHLHGSMRGHVFVTDSAWTLKTDAQGQARFEGLPAGKVEVRVWHPELLVEPLRQPVQLGEGTLQQTVQLGVVARRRRL
jgi:plastocyanin